MILNCLCSCLNNFVKIQVNKFKLTDVMTREHCQRNIKNISNNTKYKLILFSLNKILNNISKNDTNLMLVIKYYID